MNLYISLCLIFFFFLPQCMWKLEINIQINNYIKEYANQSHNNLQEEILSIQGTEKIKEDVFKLGIHSFYGDIN